MYRLQCKCFYKTIQGLFPSRQRDLCCRLMHSPAPQEPCIGWLPTPLQVSSSEHASTRIVHMGGTLLMKGHRTSDAARMRKCCFVFCIKPGHRRSSSCSTNTHCNSYPFASSAERNNNIEYGNSSSRLQHEVYNRSLCRTVLELCDLRATGRRTRRQSTLTVLQVSTVKRLRSNLRQLWS